MMNFLFLYDSNTGLPEVPVEGIDLIDAEAFHDDKGERIVDADRVFL
ncbi:hypothetical protein Metfor_1858 [Methanoregula formicica SMSP]|uniref:Uncharacterized protein n=1 Tax=Methanoregula formicica (strain DSM 22288 / NBRC 105244 / SMSP) TaxID=593750 RepID=L0HIH3_METFS|nr:hypothetical protein Metfor_1858 [Methanoregula formicica SMSP]